MHDCTNCSGGCSGCSGELVLSPEECQILQTLGQFPFLPVARRADDMTPIYLEDEDLDRETASLALQLLEKKALIAISYDAPLKGAAMDAYRGYPVHGSMALTARGQQVLALMELQGVQPE